MEKSKLVVPESLQNNKKVKHIPNRSTKKKYNLQHKNELPVVAVNTMELLVLVTVLL